MKDIAFGVEGTTTLYTVFGIPYIPEGIDVCVKTWKETTWKSSKKAKKEELLRKDLKQRRDSTVTKAILGGLDHLGIVGSFAITTEDPPRLVYDFYNGGTIAGMLRRLDMKKYGLGELAMHLKGCTSVDISEMRHFMKTRMCIFHAILDTMDHVHARSQCHNNLHLGNIFLNLNTRVERNSTRQKCQRYM